MCRTAPNAIRSLTGGARLPRAAKPSPRNDASATALRGALDASVRILLSNISKLGGEMIIVATMMMVVMLMIIRTHTHTRGKRTNTHKHTQTHAESESERARESERE